MRSKGMEKLLRLLLVLLGIGIGLAAAQLGLEGYMQEKSSARETYIPEFYEGKAGTPSVDETKP